MCEEKSEKQQRRHARTGARKCGEMSRWLLRSPRNVSGFWAPRTGLLTCAFTSHLPRSRPAGLSPVVSRAALREQTPGLILCPLFNDDSAGRGAHSCGAVAEFHRLPEHPGDCRSGCVAGYCRDSDAIKLNFMVSRFSAAATIRSTHTMCKPFCTVRAFFGASGPATGAWTFWPEGTERIQQTRLSPSMTSRY